MNEGYVSSIIDYGSILLSIEIINDPILSVIFQSIESFCL